MDIFSIIFGIILGFFLWFFIVKIGFFSQVKQIRQNAIRGSRNAIFWEIYEKILPILPDFPYAPKDMVFIGKWCDYIIFDGLSEWNLQEIIFLELKSGKSRLNGNERAIRRTIEMKHVRFSEMRIDLTKNEE